MFNQKNITLRPVITAGAWFIHPLIICWSRRVKIHLYLQVPADLQPCELLPCETKQPPCVATTVCFYAQFIQSDACLCFSRRVRCNSCVQSPAGRLFPRVSNIYQSGATDGTKLHILCGKISEEIKQNYSHSSWAFERVKNTMCLARIRQNHFSLSSCDLRF